MQVKRRLFPYPVLNQDTSLSTYNTDSKFEFVQDSQDVEGKNFIIKNAKYILNNSCIENLIKQGKAEAVCVIECSDTLFRKTYPISDEPKDIIIENNKLNGLVSVSAFVYAKEKIENFKDTTFCDDYADYEFVVDKYGFLAVDDGIQFRLDYPEADDDKVSSIFLVVPNGDEKEELTKIECNSKKIKIVLPKKAFDTYYAIKDNDNYKDIFFSILVIPALTYALEKAKSEDFDMLVSGAGYVWFGTIMKAFKKQKGEELDETTFVEMDSIELAQILMNKPIGRAIGDLYTVGMPTLSGGDDDE